ncbi:MAG: sulfatase [Bacteroidales bacterium]|nr:sulfatase [Bacteroidales bacterium]
MNESINKAVYLVILTLMLGSAGCTNKEKITDTGVDSDLPNIVLIVADDHGTNDLGCYGNIAVKTPNLDYLATEGIRFTQAYCTSASCSASRSVILTGLYNHANGHFGHMHHYHHFSAFDHVYSLPVYLEELAGYHTGRIGKYHVAPEEVFYFQEVMQANARNPAAMADSCIGFIESNREHPFFLYFCTSDPHRARPVSDEPLAPDSFGNIEGGHEGVEETYFTTEDVNVPPYLPDSRACQEELAQYYQSVARVDQGVGRLFDHLKQAGVWDKTVVIYISDNGIAFAGAKTTIYQPGINLPCLIKNAKGGNKGLVTDAMINWADLTPTILDLAGVLSGADEMMQERLEDPAMNWNNTANESFQGHSFKSVLENVEAEGWDETYASHTFHEITMYYPMKSVISRKFKLIWNIAWQLPYPHASDLWSSSTWQVALKSGSGMYAGKSINEFTNRPEFELYNLEIDPYETRNLAQNPAYEEELEGLKKKLYAFQERTNDPWILKWEHE